MKRKNWLEKELDKKQAAIREWQIIACRTNICDKHGKNPIDELKKDVYIIKALIESVK